MPEEETKEYEQEVSYDPLTDLLALVEDIKVEDDDKGSALGSIGLKPKIVH